MTHTHGASSAEHGHAGDGGAAVVFGRGVRAAVGAVLALLLVATVAGLVLLWPSGATTVSTGLGLGGEQVRGTVAEARRGPCPGVGGEDGGSPAGECVTVTVTVDDGPDAGEIVVLTQAEGPATRRLEPGTGLVLASAPDLPLESRYQVVDLQRGPPLLLLAALFAVAVVAVGRWRGLAALVGLAATFAVLTLFVLPALLEGSDPLLVAVVGSSAIMFVSLYLSHGVSVRTTVALLGTLVSLVLTGALASLFVVLGRFSGLVSEEAAYLSATTVEIDLRGLLLAGILIGALGVLDDVTVTQTSAVFELHAANPRLGRAGLAARAMRIGRDHIASTVNTLVLAYAGASLPLMLLFVLAAQPVTDTLTNEVVAQEVVRALVGGIGIVASVPLTTALAALVAPRARTRPVAEGPSSQGSWAPAAGDAALAGDRPGTAPERLDGPVDEEPLVPGLGPSAPAAGPIPTSPPPAPRPDPQPGEPQPGEPQPGEARPSRRRRRGSRAARAEREAEELLRGLRATEPSREDTDPPGDRHRPV